MCAIADPAQAITMAGETAGGELDDLGHDLVWIALSQEAPQKLHKKKKKNSYAWDLRRNKKFRSGCTEVYVEKTPFFKWTPQAARNSAWDLRGNKKVRRGYTEVSVEASCSQPHKK